MIHFMWIRTLHVVLWPYGRTISKASFLDLQKLREVKDNEDRKAEYVLTLNITFFKWNHPVNQNLKLQLPNNLTIKTQIYTWWSRRLHQYSSLQWHRNFCKLKTNIIKQHKYSILHRITSTNKYSYSLLDRSYMQKTDTILKFKT